MSNNPFVLPTDSYKRAIDPLGQYIEQTAHYLVKMRGISKEEAVAFVRTSIKDGTYPTVSNPKITFLERQSNGDREKKTDTLINYLYGSLKARELIAPTLTTYLNPQVKKSLLVKYIDKNIRLRSKAKKEMFKAKAVNNKELARIKNQEQNNKKTKNNSLSGAQVSASTPIANKTAHSTLTSNCRSTSGYGNANNEKLLAGNRHYWSVDVTVNNIVSIIKHTDYDRLQKFVEKYNIHIPTIAEVMECVRYSTDFYWRDPKGHAKVSMLVQKLDPLERAAFVYTGDLYHLAKYNGQVMRSFIKGLSTKVTGPFIDDSKTALEYLQSSPTEVIHLARNICIAEMTGKTEEYELYKDTPELAVLASTTKLIRNTIDEYADLIATIMVTDNVPASVAHIPTSIRRVALTSDTDSTIFTVENWVTWYYEDEFVKPGDPVAAAMIFLAAQAIIHILAKMSANFGVEREKLYLIAMKNEYKFDVYVPTNVAKHYYAIKNVQEGIILNPVEYEIKGVHLKNSNAPAIINEKALDMMKHILNTVAEGKKLSILYYLKQIGDIERDIYTKIREGSPIYLRRAEIKNHEAYSKGPMESPYMFHDLWEKVLAPKYGYFSEPPYATVRIATELDSPTRTADWLAAIKDRDFAKRMSDWLKTNKRNKLPSIMIPSEVLGMHGIPEELLEAMDIRKIVSDITKTFYMIMETLGFYISNDKLTRLISDHY